MVIKKELRNGTSLVAQWPRFLTSNAGGPRLITGQGTGCHMPQLRVCMPQQRPRAAK